MQRILAYILMVCALAYAAIAIFGCADGRLPTTYYASLDPAFTVQERLVIEDAAARWNVAVGLPGRLTVVVTDDPCVGDASDPGAHICIQRLTSYDPRCENGAGCTGVTPGDNFTTMRLDTAFGDTGTLSHIAQHELGHALGLWHTDVGTLMYKDVTPTTAQDPTTGAAQDITAEDVKNYLSIHPDTK